MVLHLEHRGFRGRQWVYNDRQELQIRASGLRSIRALHGVAYAGDIAAGTPQRRAVLPQMIVYSSFIAQPIRGRAGTLPSTYSIIIITSVCTLIEWNKMRPASTVVSSRSPSTPTGSCPCSTPSSNNLPPTPPKSPSSKGCFPPSSSRFRTPWR